jgi:F-type H+-transporting ATPase subunit a
MLLAKTTSKQSKLINAKVSRKAVNTIVNKYLALKAYLKLASNIKTIKLVKSSLSSVNFKQISKKATKATKAIKATSSQALTNKSKTTVNKNYISLRTANLVPTKNTIIGRFIVENVDSYTRANAGQQALLPLILALFLVIAISNTLSNVPYGYAAASSLSFSLGLSLSVFIAVTASALTLLGMQWFAHFALDSPSFLAPILVLIETISYSARAVSLGVRLFANLVAGHALLNIISKMGKQSILSRWFLLPLIVLPTAILGVIIVLELAVAQIQAYVFTVLTTIYDSESKEKPVFDLH